MRENKTQNGDPRSPERFVNDGAFGPLQREQNGRAEQNRAHAPYQFNVASENSVQQKNCRRENRLRAAFHV